MFGLLPNLHHVVGLLGRTQTEKNRYNALIRTKACDQCIEHVHGVAVWSSTEFPEVSQGLFADLTQLRFLLGR